MIHLLECEYTENVSGFLYHTIDEIISFVHMLQTISIQSLVIHDLKKAKTSAQSRISGVP